MQENECIENVPNCPPRDPITPIDFTDDGNGGNGGNTIAPKWDWEVVCLSNDNGQTKVAGVAVFNMQDPQTPSTTLYLNGTDVTGQYSIVPCGDEQIDREIISKCYQDTADPTIRYERLTVLDLSQTPSVPIETIWLDDSGASIAAPNNVEVCGGATSVAHVNGCIEREVTTEVPACSMVTNQFNFNSSEWLSQEKTSQSGSGQFTISNTFDSSTTADRFEALLNQIATGESRVEQHIVSASATLYLHPAQFVSSNRLSPTVVEYSLDFSSANDTPTALTAPCTDPITNAEYTSSNQNANSGLSNLPLNNPVPIGAGLNFTVRTYSIVNQETITLQHIPAKQVVEKLSDGTLEETYYTPGEINTEIAFVKATDVFKNTCTNDYPTLPLGECSSQSVENNTYGDATYDFQGITAILGADNIKDFSDYSNNVSDGLVVDGNIATALVPKHRSLSASFVDGQTISTFFDSLGNSVAAVNPVTWNAGSDPNGTTFLADLEAEITTALSNLNLTAPTNIVSTVTLSGGAIDVRIDVEGTEDSNDPNYLAYLQDSNSAQYWFYNVDHEFEYGALIDTSSVVNDPDSITVSMVLDIPNGQQAIIGAMIDGIMGDGASPYLVVTGTGAPTTYTYTFPVSGVSNYGNNTGAYTITAASLAGGVRPWVYFSGDAGYQWGVDGFSIEISGLGQVVKKPGVDMILCQKQIDELKEAFSGGSTPVVTGETTNSTIVDGSTFFLPQGVNIRQISITPQSGAQWELSTDGGNNWQLALDSAQQIGTGVADERNNIGIRSNSGERILVVWDIEV
jgi:hypothetical protein